MVFHTLFDPHQAIHCTHWFHRIPPYCGKGDLQPLLHILCSGANCGADQQVWCRVSGRALRQLASSHTGRATGLLWLHDFDGAGEAALHLRLLDQGSWSSINTATTFVVGKVTTLCAYPPGKRKSVVCVVWSVMCARHDC